MRSPDSLYPWLTMTTTHNALDHDGFLVTTEWLSEHLNHPNLRLFDATSGDTLLREGSDAVGTGFEAYQAAHIPGARYIDLQADLSDAASAIRFTLPDPSTLKQAIEHLGIGTGDTVVVYSTSTYGWATRVWLQLREAGFTRAAVLDGGRKKWTAEQRPLQSGVLPPYPGATLAGVPAAKSYFVGKVDVLEGIVAPETVCVVNALDEDQHSGKKPAKAGRPGHIAGSANVPVGSLVETRTNEFKSKDQIRESFEAAGITASKRIITYCGGGIAATADAFALLRIGHDDVAVYDASLAEWALDPTLPMLAPAAGVAD